MLIYPLGLVGVGVVRKVHNCLWRPAVVSMGKASSDSLVCNGDLNLAGGHQSEVMIEMGIDCLLQYRIPKLKNSGDIS